MSTTKKRSMLIPALILLLLAAGGGLVWYLGIERPAEQEKEWQDDIAKQLSQIDPLIGHEVEERQDLTDPNLSGGSNPLPHNIQVSWGCECDGGTSRTILDSQE